MARCTWARAESSGTLRRMNRGRRITSRCSIAPAADRGFKDIWRTIATPDGVFFGSYERLFRWNPQTGLNVWRPAEHERFYLTFREGNSLYVQESRAGLERLDRDSLRTIHGGDRFTKERIYCVAGHQGRLLVGTPAGVFLQDDGVFQPYPTEADAFLRKAQPFSCSALPEGRLAVTTLRGGVVLFDGNGRIERILNENSGISSDAVTAAYQDREGGLWLTSVSGVTRVEARAPLSMFDERDGLAGSVTAIARQSGVLYAGTTTGLYRLKDSPPGDAATFEAVQDINEEVLALLSTEAGLLVGAKSGVYQLQGKRVRLIRTSDYVYDLSASKISPAMVYASGKDGLALLRESGGRWTDGGQVAGIGQALRKAVETPSGVWLGTDFQGLLLVSGLPGHPAVEAFGAKDGLPAGAILPVRIGSRVVFLSAKGILSFDPKSRRFSPDTVLAPLFAGRADQPLILVEDPQGANIWAGSKIDGGVLRRQADGRYQWDETPLRRIGETEIQAIHVDPDGVTWSGTADGIVRYDPAIPKDYGVRFSALVRRLSDIEEKRIHFGGHGVAKRKEFAYEGNSLRFRFAAPSFDDEARTEYRVYLQGFDRGWSPWTQETRKDYTNLPPQGAYVFRVAARNLYGATSEEGAIAFSVLPPWYRTWWGYSLGALAVGLALFGVVRWRLRQLAEQNRRLQKTVEERTAELREKNSTLTEMNHTLSQLNSEKNEFMGIAAHDLKNPLGAIRGFAEMLEEDVADMPQEEVVDTAAKIKKSANLMFALVSNLLDVNRIEQNKMEVNLEPCDLWETVRQTVENYRQRALAKQIQLHFGENERPPLVVADATQLVQIMDNLVSNAVKYSPNGKNVYVRVYQMDRRIRAEVKDEGPGISAEDQRRLFGKFARLSARPTAGEHSTGLGLAIVKRLVESMHGEVWCESHPGDGAAFLVELPAAVEASAAAAPRA
jgi:Signal transduction histidine kinase